MLKQCFYTSRKALEASPHNLYTNNAFSILMKSIVLFSESDALSDAYLINLIGDTIQCFAMCRYNNESTKIKISLIVVSPLNQDFRRNSYWKELMHNMSYLSTALKNKHLRK